MLFQTLTVVLSLVGAVTPYPAAGSEKRADTTDLQLYAYGTGISGLQVYGGDDGKAYLSTGPSSNLTELVWPEPSVDAPWNVTLSTNTSLSASFYIVASEGAFDSAGFKKPNETAPTGAMMKGFFKFGSQIMWANDSTYESKFWAQTTEVAGLYKLVWNSNNVDKTDSVPVTVKTVSSE